MGLGDKMFKGLAWSAIERLAIQAVQFVIQIVLARLLTPSEYGTMGILTIFIALSLVFIDSGFTKALIQKKDRTEDDISTVFLFNIGISLVAYLILFIIAPYLSTFYGVPELKPLLRFLSLSLIINAMFAVPATLYTIKLDFKLLTKINFIAAVVSGGIAYYMALNSFGVWSLVGLTLSRSILTAVLTWYYISWKPNWKFSTSSFKQLFSFGSNVLASSLLNVAVNKSYELVIPKVNSTQDLGYYTRGTQFTDFIFGFINTIFDRVLLPGLTEVQDQLDILISHTRNIIKAAAVVVIPIFFLLALVAEPLVTTLLTEKWLPAVPILQLFCFARLISIISGINVNILYVLGRSDLVLKQQYIKLLFRVVFLLIALKYGIIFIAVAELTSTLVHFFINTYYPGRIMKYGAISQIQDLSPMLLAGFIMVCVTFGATYFIHLDWLKLFVSLIVALPIYYLTLRLLNINELDILVLKAVRLFKKQ